MLQSRHVIHDASLLDACNFVALHTAWWKTLTPTERSYYHRKAQLMNSRITIPAALLVLLLVFIVGGMLHIPPLFILFAVLIGAALGVLLAWIYIHK